MPPEGADNPGPMPLGTPVYVPPVYPRETAPCGYPPPTVLPTDTCPPNLGAVAVALAAGKGEETDDDGAATATGILGRCDAHPINTTPQRDTNANLFVNRRNILAPSLH